MYKVYVSGAPTDVKHPAQTKAFYEKIGFVCEEIFFKLMNHIYTLIQ
jgi:hypothetical protein